MRKCDLKINTLYSKSNRHSIYFVYEFVGFLNGKIVFRVYENLTSPTDNYIVAFDSDILEFKEVLVL